MNVKVIRGFRQLHLLKEELRHVVVEMLAGMHDDFLNVRILRQCAGNHGRFDELRSGSENSDDFEGSIIQCNNKLDGKSTIFSDYL